MKTIILFLFLIAGAARADSIYMSNIPGYATGTQSNGHNALDINIASGSVTATNPSVSSTGSAVPSQATFIGAQNGSGNLVGLLTGQQTMANSLACVLPSNQSAIPVTESGTWNVGINAGSNTIGAVTQSGTWTVQPGNTANTTAWLVTGTGGTFPATQSGSWTVSTKAPVNANGFLNSNQSVTTTESTISAPANAVAVLVQARDSNTANVNYGFSNSGTAILASGGPQLQPGRDSGQLSFGTGSVLHLISASGTQTIDVQWVLSQ